MTTYNAMPVTSIAFKSDSNTGGSVPSAFDASLYKPLADDGPLKLTIRLGIKLQRAAPDLVPIQPDHDGKPFWTSPWTGADWLKFVQAATAQADMWNKKLWLLPPSTFSEFDKTYPNFPGQAYRPNIQCELSVNFNPDVPHKTIDVYNLNIGVLRAAGLPLDPGVFRSDALVYDSLDATPWAFPYGHGPGQPAKHFVIAHEIGHAMGLDHIGVILKTPLCEFAKNNQNTFGRYDPNAKGGSNSFYCYGLSQGLAVVGNIMGAGDKFTVDDAAPWIWAMLSIRKKRYEVWRPTTTDPGSASWVRT
jgi:hypothetical protein